ncbi:MAG: YqaE/Pmp3 family membrane protein [Bacteroidetes bacterium]|nr:YqaE/Pmp3 family membrane protein [Bacteroidota bacterium]
MTFLEVILAILLPPLAVGLRFGIGGKFFLNLLLAFFFWLPAVIHAFIVLSNREHV